MTTNRSPRLGHLLLERGLLEESDLTIALQIHEETGKPLGTILTDDLRVISVPTLADSLLLQQRWKPLGELLVETGVLDEGQLLEALDEQRRTGQQLGEIVRERFYLSQVLLDKLLDRQRELQIEIEQGYGSGLRSALLGRADATEPRQTREVKLGERLELGRSGADPHVVLAVKAAEAREGEIASLSDRVNDQRTELERVRDALHDRQLTIIELEQRVAELEALLATA